MVVRDWGLVFHASCIRVWGHSSLSYYRPLHTRDRLPMAIALRALPLVEKAEQVHVRFTWCLRDQRSMWVQDGCKVYMDPYMASNGSCFVVTWTIFKNLLLEVGRTQKWETMAFQNVINRWFIIILIMCEDPAWIENHQKSIWLRAWTHMASHYTWGLVTTLHGFGSSWDSLLNASFELSQFHGHNSWFVCGRALRWGLK
jgi:hypothetical protein